MEVHRTKTPLTRLPLEVFFSINIGYVGMSMVFCAIPSVSIPFAQLEFHLNHLLHIRQTDYIRGYFEIWVPSLISALCIWSLFRVTRCLSFTEGILRLAGAAILLFPAVIWTCAYTRNNWTLQWPYKPVFLEAALAMVCLWVFLKAKWNTARWIGISAFLAHSTFWCWRTSGRFHALDWGIPVYGGPAGLILDFCTTPRLGFLHTRLETTSRPYGDCICVADVCRRLPPRSPFALCSAKLLDDAAPILRKPRAQSLDTPPPSPLA